MSKAKARVVRPRLSQLDAWKCDDCDRSITKVYRPEFLTERELLHTWREGERIAVRCGFGWVCRFCLQESKERAWVCLQESKERAS